MREAAEQVCPAFWIPALTRTGSAALEVGVGEDELRRLAAEFERHRRDMARGRRLDQRPDCERAGEGEVVDARMARERRAGLLAEARHDVERAGGKARLAGEVGERERGQAGVLRRLQDAGIAHRERRADRLRPTICIG